MLEGKKVYVQSAEESAMVQQHETGDNNRCCASCSNDYGDMYDYCPNCGYDWSNDADGVNHECDKRVLVELRRPRFWISDLENYSEEFVRKIARWQDLQIRVLTNPNDVSEGEILSFMR